MQHRKCYTHGINWRRLQTNFAISKLMTSGSDSISMIGLHTTFASNVLRNVRSGTHVKSSSGNVKYSTVSMQLVKYSKRKKSPRLLAISSLQRNSSEDSPSRDFSSKHSFRYKSHWSKNAFSSFVSWSLGLGRSGVGCGSPS